MRYQSTLSLSFTYVLRTPSWQLYLHYIMLTYIGCMWMHSLTGCAGPKCCIYTTSCWVILVSGLAMVCWWARDRVWRRYVGGHGIGFGDGVLVGTASGLAMLCWWCTASRYVVLLPYSEQFGSEFYPHYSEQLGGEFCSHYCERLRGQVCSHCCERQGGEFYATAVNGWEASFTPTAVNGWEARFTPTIVNGWEARLTPTAVNGREASITPLLRTAGGRVFFVSYTRP